MAAILPPRPRPGKLTAMIFIPHSIDAALREYAAPLAALASVAVAALACGKGPSSWRPAVSVLVGWALLAPLRALPQAAWAPHRALEVLLAPAVASAALLGLVAWRGIARPRLVATGLAVFAGWWVARELVGVVDFWRVWVALALLPLLFRRTVGEAPGPGMVTGLALAGGLAVVGAPAGMVMAALVAAACGLGELALGGQAIPWPLLATLVGVVDVGGGRLLHGRVGAVDLACLGALAAPVLAGAVERRAGKGGSSAGVALSGAAGAAGSVALVWLFRRALLT